MYTLQIKAGKRSTTWVTIYIAYVKI